VTTRRHARASAIVLAGGRSRRFGADKLQARLADGRSVLAHAVAGVAAVADEIVVVVAPGAVRADGLPARVVLVHDPEPGGGPLMGLAAGLETATGEIVVVVGGDMPALDVSVLRLLIAAAAADPAIDGALLEIDGAPRVSVLPCVVRRSAARRACGEALAAGDRRLRGALERLVTTVVPAGEWRALDPSGRTLLDIDRPSDLAAFERSTSQET
jgi:molybdopterin-guanine dinucleotide biosynthesis protein A